MVIRLIDGAHEEQHAFNLTGMSRHKEIILTGVALLTVTILLMPGDKPRNIGFTLHGHTWKAQIGDRLSRIISAQGAISVGGVYNIELEGGASRSPGDYLYRSGSLRWDVESGMWGILRIKRRNNCCRCQRDKCDKGDQRCKPKLVSEGFEPDWAALSWCDK